ncbi:hypothetical protein H8L32_25580 [Undibacterium sp. CY18W]|uniref:SGNH hydrolase-type esterase domain-containing protein n=1 Tax=Undibacterium hunanense TaxID=2762292 RepID=A0ABR6ZYG0_9BURK|nr:hypothetical protein [Undibacterium hunanense]MBC3920861.1 hypothetical protein [Undibacterium hunanense]
MRVYQKNEQWVAGEYPAILAIGDSWFWYPGNNILQALIRNNSLSANYSNIQAVGNNGAPLQDYVGAGKYARDVEYNLTPDVRKYYNVFMISGAGNDAIDYKLALKTDCTGITDPKACLDPTGIDDLLRKIATAMGGLIHEIRWAYKDAVKQVRPIFIHGYDYPVPDGRGFNILNKLVTGPWLLPALDAAKVKKDPAFRLAVVHELIDRLNGLFKTFDDWRNDVVYIDSRGTLSSGADYKTDWANEMHPTSSGFDKIVAQRWIPILKQWGIAK